MDITPIYQVKLECRNNDTSKYEFSDIAAWTNAEAKEEAMKRIENLGERNVRFAFYAVRVERLSRG